MKYNFIERKLQVDGEIIAYAEKKVGKLDKYFKRESEASVTFSTERGRCRAEVTLNNNGTYFRASELTSDMHASIDSAVAAIERQIRKHKTRLSRRLREDAFDAVDVDYFAEDMEEDDEPVIRVKKFEFHPMSPEEAIMQMNLLGHEFYVFTDMEREATCVVYRRHDGSYGLIEPM